MPEPSSILPWLKDDVVWDGLDISPRTGLVIHALLTSIWTFVRNLVPLPVGSSRSVIQHQVAVGLIEVEREKTLLVATQIRQQVDQCLETEKDEDVLQLVEQMVTTFVQTVCRAMVVYHRLMRPTKDEQRTMSLTSIISCPSGITTPDIEDLPLPPELVDVEWMDQETSDVIRSMIPKYEGDKYADNTVLLFATFLVGMCEESGLHRGAVARIQQSATKFALKLMKQAEKVIPYEFGNSDMEELRVLIRMVIASTIKVAVSAIRKLSV